MNQHYIFLAVALLFIANFSQAQFQYISPQPGSKYHQQTTTIILKHGEKVDAVSLKQKNLFKIEGSLSGRHEVKIKLLEEEKTIVLLPIKPFAAGETVTVAVADGIRSAIGSLMTGTTFQFEIQPPRTKEEEQRIAEHMRQVYEEEFGSGGSSTREDDPSNHGLPEFDILVNTTPAPGHVFFSHFDLYLDDDSHYCIIESDGDSVYGKYDTLRYNNFELNKNGYLTVFNEDDSSFAMLDSNYLQIASYQMGNGYKADVHEFVIYPNGNHYMMCYDPQIVDMTVYNPSYQPNATVIGLVIQELDAGNNVIFEWRSWDHFSILDGDHINFANIYIDYCHGNSIMEDVDGNIIISCRNMSEVTKINRLTGDIIWRLGGKNNQFTFIGDPERFSYQHDAQRLANGNLTLFDNGNYHSPPKSWAKEYSLDETNMTATLEWNFKRTVVGGDVYANAMGTMQRLPNGNTFICWGLTNSLTTAPHLTEVDAAGVVVWEMKLATQDPIYKGRRNEWEPCARPSSQAIYVDKITPVTAKVHWNASTNANKYDVQYRILGNTTWKTKGVTKTQKKLINLTPETTYEYRLKSHCDSIATTASKFTAIKTFTTLPLREMLIVQEENLFIYPNPASHSVEIELETSDEEEATISIYDMAGKTVLKALLLPENGSLHLDVSELTGGVYLVEAKTVRLKIVEKFVKE